MSCYQCQGCNRILDWDTDVQHPDPDRAEVKSIASRFCQDCIWLDADGQGLSIDRIVADRLLSHRPLRIDSELRSALFALLDENPWLFAQITRCLFERARLEVPIGRAPNDLDVQLEAKLKKMMHDATGTIQMDPSSSAENLRAALAEALDELQLALNYMNGNWVTDYDRESARAKVAELRKLVTP